MRRAVAAGAVVTVVVAGGGAAFALAGGDGQAAPPPSLSTPTAEITRGDLVDTASVDGTLTYADERAVQTGAAGTVTWAPEAGATITRGRSLFKVDGRPVTLMYGDLPLYRALRDGVSDGKDVRQLERNLRALGYGDGLTVDETFSAATADAVEEWQHDRGLPETGGVDAAQVVFQPGAVRIKEAKVVKGGRTSPGQPALTVTGTRRIVHVDLDSDKQDLARKGAVVGIELPGGTSVEGRIAEIGTVAEQSGGQGEEEKTTIDVEITLVGKSGRLDQAPVTVELESERRENVLSVPVEALLALREGGFGVEVVEGTARRILPVTLGTFGAGRVEITGAGLRDGMKVGVPAS
ncbi:peptidoglycan-binding protein [Actinomadura scrupuli]|uniref:peptidoglycan-binding protein n=1 Tax=Actinomadura scrupuli TaxID=559629 RepID=UPI003D95561B